MSKILITGASSGFGALTVKALLEKGHTVTASMRNSTCKNLEFAKELKDAGALIVEIDVTNDSSVTDGVENAHKMMGGIDVLINNAGIAVMGMHEFFTIEDYYKVFEVNVFGVQRMNRAVIPYLRETKKGLIIYTSSLNGRFIIPFYGPYTVSKWALEALAESYRVELSTFGIENCVIEPGAFPTNLSDKALTPSDTTREKPYEQLLEVVKQVKISEDALKGHPEQRPELVAKAISDLIDLPYGEKPFRTPVDVLGLGDMARQFNHTFEQMQYSLFQQFKMEGMLSVKNHEDDSMD
jgi:NAD(P)-dependent dehydrogenase (short-subunit alcohol dehydrogenase family)